VIPTRPPNEWFQSARELRPHDVELADYADDPNVDVELFEDALGNPIPMPMEWFFESSMGVLGQTGQGKTQTIKRIIYEFYLKKRANMTIFDPNNDYWVMRDAFPEWQVIGRDAPLDPKKAGHICKMCIKNKRPLVISLAQSPRDIWVEFVLEYLKELWQCAVRYREVFGKPMAHLVVLEEAQTFCPRSLAAAQGKTKFMCANLIELIRDNYASQGRKHGPTILLATQRVPSIDTTVISQIQILFMHKVKLDVDIKRNANIMRVVQSDFSNILDRLRRGYCVVSGDFNDDGMVHYYKVRLVPIRDVSKNKTPDDVDELNEAIDRGDLGWLRL